MPRRALASVLILFAFGGLAVAETYQGSIVELTDSKVAVQARVKGFGKKPGEKKTLDLAKTVIISRQRGKAEKKLSFQALKRLVEATSKGHPLHQVFATIVTDDRGHVVAIQLSGQEVPESVETILDKADKVELYSLEPEPDEKAAKDPKATQFHGYLVLGKTTLGDANLKKARESLELGIGMGRVAKCFDPRHGIRVTKGEKTADMVICFRCGQIYFYDDPKKEERSDWASIAKGIQPTFDEILKAAKVPLALPSKD
jgi:hypothetical protein